MTDLVQVALIAATPPTIAAMCALVVGLVNHKQGSEIHVLVNSNMTAAKKKIDELEKEVKELKATVNRILNT